jgi:aryl-alcohol dehydrogenase-like predicted oxidoreductase
MTNTTFAVGGDIEVRRLGFGTMRITGPGIWGPPRDRAAARALLRRAVDLGVQLIDTADAYGNWHNMLTECEQRQIGFIPYRPLRAWDDPARQQVLTAAVSRHSANTNQIALAWLLALSPVTLPIPGTATPAHLEDNLAAAALQLEQGEIHAITAAASRATQRATQAHLSVNIPDR